jgi:hypothetical protein
MPTCSARSLPRWRSERAKVRAMQLGTFWRRALALAALLAATLCAEAGFGEPGGTLPAELDTAYAELRAHPYEMQLLLSFGTSKGGSAGHLALALREPGADDDIVYSANFYADRSPRHAQGFYTQALMLAVPKKEYLYGTASSLGPTASFGLDYGEVYKRTVIGIRVSGVPQAERDALRAFFDRLNADYQAKAAATDYHAGEITYDYMNLNCAKTIGAAFRHGAGYDTLLVRDPLPLSGVLRAVAAVSANIPTEMAMKLVRQWQARGYGMDVVLYRKWPHSPYADPHDDPPRAFASLPDRFPSVLSLDFRADEGQYEDEDNLYAMYLLRLMTRHALTIDAATQTLQLQTNPDRLNYAQADEQARSAAQAESKILLRRLPVGLRSAAGVIGEPHRPYDFTSPRPQP